VGAEPGGEGQATATRDGGMREEEVGCNGREDEWEREREVDEDGWSRDE